MEMHTQQTFEVTHHLPATSASVSSSPLQDATTALRNPAAFVLSAFAAVRRHYTARRDYEQLLEQPGYLLDDVGLTRESVQAARYGLFPRDGRTKAFPGREEARLKVAPEYLW